ncbi:hypothetical protein V2J09_020614 [Rumex salicifolius]
MAERNSSHSGILCRNMLFCLFSFISIFFILSSIFVLRSKSLLTNTGIFSRTNIIDSENPILHKSKASDLNCGAKKLSLKVFMYDLPPEFHFGLLGWKQEGSSVWPDTKTKIPPYPGGLNLQHSIEYWLTLDLLFSEFSGDYGNRVAKRVHNSSEADIVFVPFFSSLCYNHFAKAKPPKHSKDKEVQAKLVKYLEAQDEWKRSKGVDHVIMAHHPNSLSDARNELYPSNIANVQKDVIAPYMHVIKSYDDDTSTFDSRPTLLYFQGAIYRKDGGSVRQELFYLLKDEKDVHFAFGSVQKDGIKNASQGMQSSKFCLNIAGDTPSSNRLFDAITSHCVPVIISDDIELPYEDALDYSEFCIFIRASDAIKKDYLINLVRGIGRDEWTHMWKRLQEVEKYFEFRYPSRDDDAVQMIWKALARKVPSLRLKMNRSRRYSRTGDDALESEGMPPPFKVPTNFGEQIFDRLFRFVKDELTGRIGQVYGACKLTLCLPY